MMEARRDAARRASRRRGRGRRRDRPHGLVRGLGGQDRAGARLVEPRRRAVLQLHGSRADGRRRRPLRRKRRRCWGSSRGSRRRSSAATRSSPSRPSRGRSPRSSSRRRSPRPISRAASSTSSPASKDELAPWLAGHMDVNAIDVGGADGAASTELERPGGGEREAGRPRRRGRPEPVGRSPTSWS